MKSKRTRGRGARGSGSSGPRLKGRYWLVLWLLLFLVTAALVVTRQRAALLTSRSLLTLQDSTRRLDAARAALLGKIERATSLEVLVPKMEQAGMHRPTDAEQSFVAVDTLGGGTRRTP